MLPTPQGTSPVFEFLGKENNCVFDTVSGKRDWLIFSANLNDILSTISDIRIYNWFSNVRVAGDRTVGLLPIMKIDVNRHDGKIDILIKIELRYIPLLFKDRSYEIRKIIIDHLKLAPHTTLSDRIDKGDVTLEIDLYGPEALNEEIVIKI